MHKQEQSRGNGASTLALKPMGRVNRSLKQRVPVAPKNGELLPQKKFKGYIKNVRKSPDVKLSISRTILYCYGMQNQAVSMLTR